MINVFAFFVISRTRSLFSFTAKGSPPVAPPASPPPVRLTHHVTSNAPAFSAPTNRPTQAATPLANECKLRSGIFVSLFPPDPRDIPHCTSFFSTKQVFAGLDPSYFSFKAKPRFRSVVLSGPLPVPLLLPYIDFVVLL